MPSIKRVEQLARIARQAAEHGPAHGISDTADALESALQLVEAAKAEVKCTCFDDHDYEDHNERAAACQFHGHCKQTAIELDKWED